MVTEDLIHAGELLANASTNSGRSLRKTYLIEARKHLERAKKSFPKDNPEAQAAIRRVEFLVQETEYQFPELVRNNQGLGDVCPIRHCPVTSCQAEIPEGAKSCPVCGASVSINLGDIGGLVFKGDWILLGLVTIGALIWRSRCTHKRRRKRR